MKKIIIEIDDKQYEDAINDTEWDTLSLGIYLKELVKNGIPLPKGHGRLIDANTIPMYRIRGVTEYDIGYNDRTTEVENDIKNAPTIIESDKENIE